MTINDHPVLAIISVLGCVLGSMSLIVNGWQFGYNQGWWIWPLTKKGED